MKNLDEYNGLELLAFYKQRLTLDYNFYEYKINQIDGQDLESELILRLESFDNFKNSKE